MRISVAVVFFRKERIRYDQVATFASVECAHLGCDDRTFPHFATCQLLDRNRGIRGRFPGDPICPAEPNRMLTSSPRL